jgi:hypothetical protein
MTNVQQFSSRREQRDKAFFAPRLRNAQKFDRIAGYFNGSLLELVGEELESIISMNIGLLILRSI